MKEKMSLLKSLIQLANIDGKIVEREYNFLAAIGSQMGLNKDQFQSVFELDIKFQAPVNEFERIIQFQRMVLMMSVDENASKPELECIRKMGLKLGLRPMAINNVLIEMKKFPNNMIPPDVLIKIFQTHHN